MLILMILSNYIYPHLPASETKKAKAQNPHLFPHPLNSSESYPILSQNQTHAKYVKRVYDINKRKEWMLK